MASLSMDKIINAALSLTNEPRTKNVLRVAATREAMDFDSSFAVELRDWLEARGWQNVVVYAEGPRIS